MTDLSDDQTVFRQAYVLLALTRVLAKHAGPYGRGQDAKAEALARRAADDAASALLAMDAEFAAWAEGVDRDLARVSAAATAQSSAVASVKEGFLGALAAPARARRDEFEAIAWGSAAAWLGVHRAPSPRLLAVLDAARACIESGGPLDGSDAVWDVLDGRGNVIDSRHDAQPPHTSSRSMWAGYFSAFTAEADRLQGPRRERANAVAHALTFGGTHHVRLEDVPRLFGVSAKGLKSAMPGSTRERGGLTVEDVRRALGVERVRPFAPLPIKVTSLDGARIHIYNGPHPLLDAPADRDVIGHADLDLAAVNRKKWLPEDDISAVAPVRALAALAADALNVAGVEPRIEKVVVVRPGEQVLGVRVLVHLLWPQPSG